MQLLCLVASRDEIGKCRQKNHRVVSKHNKEWDMECANSLGLSRAWSSVQARLPSCTLSSTNRDLLRHLEPVKVADQRDEHSIDLGTFQTNSHQNLLELCWAGLPLWFSWQYFVFLFFCVRGWSSWSSKQQKCTHMQIYIISLYGNVHLVFMHAVVFDHGAVSLFNRSIMLPGMRWKWGAQRLMPQNPRFTMFSGVQQCTS